MTSVAALVNAPAARSTAVEDRSASQRDGDDSFARILDDDRADRDLATESEPTQPVPPLPVETPVQPKPVEAISEDLAGDKGTESHPSAAAAFQAALNNLNSDDAATATHDDVSEQADTDSSADGEAATLANAAKSGATTAAAAATVSATQTNAALLVLASASVAAATSGAQVGDAEEADTSDSAGNADGNATEGTTATVLAGVAQPAAAQTAFQTEGKTGESKVTLQSAARDSAAAFPADIAAEGDTSTPTTKDSKHAEIGQPQSTNAAASSQTSAHPVANAATQANAIAAAATSTDDAQATTNNSSAASQAAAQPASTASSLVDAARAAPTPPALQSAPAASLQVYARIIERSDGRAQRFEVRLDPAELGRIDIRIEIGADRKVHAVMAAHDSAALTDLMRGQKALERALNDAGIDLADNGLRFEIAADAGRGGASQQREGDADGRSGKPDAWRRFDTASIPVSAEAAAATTPTRRSQRLDLVA